MRKDGKFTLANSTGSTDVAVASTGSAYSPVFDLSVAVKIGLELIATSAGAVDILVKLQVSNDKTNWAAEDSYSDILNITDETRHFKTVYDAAIPAHKFGRVAFVGQGSNHASTTIAGNINVVES